MGLAQLLKPMRRADLEVEEEHAWFNRGKSCTSLSRHIHYTQIINMVSELGTAAVLVGTGGG
jgi:hypothetical protein